MRLVLRIRHVPDRQHILDRRDQESIGIHILIGCRCRADKLPIHINRAAAHPLQDTAGCLHDRAGGLREDLRERALAILQDTDHMHIKGSDVAGAVHHRIGRAIHSLRDLTYRQDIRHGRSHRNSKKNAHGHRRRNLFQ